MVIGDKSKAQLSRALAKNLTLSFNQIGRDVPTFSDAAGVADLILSSGVEYDSIAIVHNKFVSALSYEPTMIEVRPEASLRESCTSVCIICRSYLLKQATCSWFPRVRDGGGLY
jgi:F-type H+-transporting ATPase subunit gamma